MLSGIGKEPVPDEERVASARDGSSVYARTMHVRKSPKAVLHPNERENVSYKRTREKHTSAAAR